MAEKTLDQFTQATAKPGPLSLVFLRDPDLASPASRAFAFHLFMETVHDFLTVRDTTVSDPTALSPTKGQKWIIATGASGAWATHDEEIAMWDGTAWLFSSPNEGWRFYSQLEDVFYRFDNLANWTIDRFIPTFGAGDKARRMRVNASETDLEFVAGPKAGSDSMVSVGEKAITFLTAFPSGTNYTPVVIGVAGVSLFRIKTGTMAITGFTVERLDTVAQALETTGTENFSWAAIPHEDL